MLESLSIWHWGLIFAVIAIIWLPLPLAVYAMKRRLDRIAQLVERMAEGHAE